MISNTKFVCKFYAAFYNYNMTQNVYIHIPFCRRKCKYCSFVSFDKIEQKNLYLNSLGEEIISNYQNEPLKTLYIGGGTPSLLDIKDFSRIISNFNTDKNTEITTELNPENLTYQYLKELFFLGINRISLGCQTFDDDILKIIGRQHTSKQVKNVVKDAQMAGFENISLDFIYGLPTQTPDGFIKDLKEAVNLGIQHISLYGLKVEEGCYFYKHYPDNLPDDEIQAQMYLKAIEILKQSGFEHYEISNFSKKGFHSKHNLNYWNNNSYYGFGVAAHGYLDGIRYSDYLTIDEYIKNSNKRKEEHRLSQQEKLEEEIFLGFRKMSGINVPEINNRYNIDFETKYKKILEKYTSSGHIEKSKDNYKLSVKGILVSNYILADFLE